MHLLENVSINRNSILNIKSCSIENMKNANNAILKNLQYYLYKCLRGRAVNTIFGSPAIACLSRIRFQGPYPVCEASILGEGCESKVNHYFVGFAQPK